MIQLLTVLQIFYSFYWNYNVFFDCEYWARIITAVIDINMFLIGIFVIYYLYLAVDMIYKFSTTGILPREDSRKRMICTMIFLVITALISLGSFIGLNAYYSKNEDQKDLKRTNQAFALTRAASMLAEAFILSVTIWKLKASKVSRTDSGHLNLRDAVALLIL